MWPVSSTPSTPNVARMYDCMLNGKDYFPVDEDAVATVIEAIPEAVTVCRQNRAFLGRAVRYLAEEAGITQFLDLGSGLPTMQNVHEVAQEIRPDARVVYVDHDPVVVAHARKLLATSPTVQALTADLRYPEHIMGIVGTQRFLDRSRPIAVLLVSVLHFLLEDEVRIAITRLRELLPSGSYLVISHGTTDALNPGEAETLTAAYSESSSGGTNPRSHEEILGFLDGWRVISPGLVDASSWRSDPPEYPTARVLYYGVVARTRH